jgi:hypothetical protein
VGLEKNGGGNSSPTSLGFLIHKKIKLWWELSFKGVEFKVSIQRAKILHMEGLKVLGDIWQTKDNSLYIW